MELINHASAEIEQYLLNKKLKKAVVFPDGYVKEKYKQTGYDIAVPSSTALASDYIMPQLRSRGLFCSMSLFRVRIRGTHDELAILRKALAGLHAYCTQGFLYRFLPVKHRKYDISYRDYIRVLIYGAQHIARMYNIPAPEVAGVIAGKQMPLTGIPARLLIGPPSLRNNFGKYFGGNHFIELQRLNRIYDEKLSRRYRLDKTPFFLAVHTAGIGLDTIYRRSKARTYLKNSTCAALETAADQRYFFNALQILENYSRAYVCNTYALLKKTLASAFGRDVVDRYCIYNPHNTISRSNGYIYRHNAINLDDNPVSYVSGNYNMDSLLVVKGENAERYLNSLDHGYARLLSTSAGKTSGAAVTRLLCSQRTGTAVSREPVCSPDVLEPYIQFLERTKAARPVASLQPVVNCKQVS